MLVAEVIRRDVASGLSSSHHHERLTIVVLPLCDEARALIELDRRSVVRQDLYLETIEALPIRQLEESLQEGPVDASIPEPLVCVQADPTDAPLPAPDKPHQAVADHPAIELRLQDVGMEESIINRHAQYTSPSITAGWGGGKDGGRRTVGLLLDQSPVFHRLERSIGEMYGDRGISVRRIHGDQGSVGKADREVEQLPRFLFWS